MFDTILTFAGDYVPTVLAVLGGLTVVAAAIAPLTKTTIDDRALTGLKWLQDKLSRLSLAQAATPVYRPVAGAKGATVVKLVGGKKPTAVDRRKKK